MSGVVQVKAAGGSSASVTSLTKTFTTLPAAGDGVAVFIGSGFPAGGVQSVASVTDNQSGNTYKRVLGFWGLEVWFCPGVTTPSGSFTVTVNYSGTAVYGWVALAETQSGYYPDQPGFIQSQTAVAALSVGALGKDNSATDIVFAMLQAGHNATVGLATLVWIEEDLLNLLCQRIRGSTSFDKLVGTAGRPDNELFDLVFPPKVASGSRNPTTWNWILARIRDGNSVQPPRNLVDLANKAREIQLRAEDRTPRPFGPGVSLMEPASIRRALQRLSESRVQDTLLAEAPELAPLIERFRDGKAEHNVDSLSSLLKMDPTQIRAAIKPLLELGFMEEIGDIFKIPMLYRDGLGITQGKAYTSTDVSTDEEEE